MPQFVHEKEKIPAEAYKFCGTLLPKQKKMIKTIPNKFVNIGRCDKCIVQPLMRVFGIDLKKNSCGGKHLFQKFFFFFSTFCDITQIFSSEFISNINSVSSARIVKI